MRNVKISWAAFRPNEDIDKYSVTWRKNFEDEIVKEHPNFEKQADFIADCEGSIEEGDQVVAKIVAIANSGNLIDIETITRVCT